MKRWHCSFALLLCNFLQCRSDKTCRQQSFSEPRCQNSTCTFLWFKCFLPLVCQNNSFQQENSIINNCNVFTLLSELLKHPVSSPSVILLIAGYTTTAAACVCVLSIRTHITQNTVHCSTNSVTP